MFFKRILKHGIPYSGGLSLLCASMLAMRKSICIHRLFSIRPPFKMLLGLAGSRLRLLGDHRLCCSRYLSAGLNLQRLLHGGQLLRQEHFRSSSRGCFLAVDYFQSETLQLLHNGLRGLPRPGSYRSNLQAIDAKRRFFKSILSNQKPLILVTWKYSEVSLSGERPTKNGTNPT